MAGVLDGQPVSQDITSAGFLQAVVEVTTDLAMSAAQQAAIFSGSTDATFTLPLLSAARNVIGSNPFAAVFTVANVTDNLLTLACSGSDQIRNPFPPTGPTSSIQFRNA